MTESPITSMTARVTQDDLVVNIKSFERHLKPKNLSPRTVKTYMETCRLFARYLEAQGMPRLVGNIKREHIEAFLADILDRGLSAATAANRYRSLVQFFKFLEAEGELKKGRYGKVLNPMANISPPIVPEQLPPLLTEDELRRLLDACEGSDFVSRRDVALLRVFIDTGARLNEIAGLRLRYEDEEGRELSDIDLDAGVLTIMGKGRRVRAVSIGDKTTHALDRYLRRRDLHPQQHQPWLWLGHKGKFADNGIFQMIKRRGRQVGLNLHPHLFRHTFAHRWQVAEGPETALQTTMGWQGPAMIRRYAKSAASERALAVAKKLKLGDRV